MAIARKEGKREEESKRWDQQGEDGHHDGEATIVGAT
jgi:hypothetical protein